MANVTEKSVVVVSRKWNEPKIVAWINHEEVGALMSLDDFVTALIQEVGSPAMMFTGTALANKVKQASMAVLDELKSKTSHVA